MIFTAFFFLEILDYNQGATKRGMCNFNNRGAYESVILTTQNDDAITEYCTEQGRL